MSVSQVHFQIDRARDPDGAKLRALLEADTQASFWTRARDALTGTLALSSVVLVSLALDPRLVTDRAKWAIALAWAAAATALVASIAQQRVWYRRRDELAAAIAGAPLRR